jgi:hypothetical protein
MSLAHCLSSKALAHRKTHGLERSLYEASLAQIGNRLQSWRFHSVEERTPIGFCKCIGYAQPLVSHYDVGEAR